MNLEELSNMISGLFAREEFTAHLLQRSFRQPIGWIELAGVIVLGIILQIFSHQLIKNQKLDNIQNRFVKHLAERLLFPAMMLFSGTILLLVCNALDLTVVWLRLFVFGASWMLMIRVVLALLKFALPAGRLSSTLEHQLATFLWASFLLWVIGFDDLMINWAKSLQFSIGSSKLSLFTLITGILWVGIIMIFMMWLAKWLDSQLMSSKHLDINLRIVLSKIIKTLLMVLSVLIALPIVGIDLTVLSVFGGALGVGLGFGLQKIASNYVSGFIILADRSIRPGDRLTVNNFTGYVTEITSRFVVLRSGTGQEALIPNETFVTSTVINESYTGKSLYQTLNVQVAYHTDLTLALEILEQAAAAQERVEGKPSAYLIGFGDNGIDLRVGFWVRDPENGFLGLYSAILMTIWKRFNEEDIEFPFPQREIRILPEEQTPSDMAILKAGLQAQQDTKSNEPIDS